MKYNIYFELSGLFVLIVELYILYTQYAKTTKANRLFRLLVWSLFIDEILDILTAVMISFAEKIPDPVNTAVNTLYFLFASVCEFVALSYVIECVNIKSRIARYSSFAMTAIYAIILIINSFQGILFYFDNHVYHQGPLFIANFIVPAYCSAAFLVLTFVYKKRLKTKQIISNIIFVVITILGTALQMLIFKDTLLILFGFSIATIFVLFSLETPDYRELEYLRSNLEREVDIKTSELVEKERKISQLSMEIVRALAGAIDAKDEYTKGHSARVAQYSVKLAERLGMHDEELSKLRYISVLHDVGKIGIPDIVLNKPGKLTDEEYQIIKKHTTIGAEILDNIDSLEEIGFIAQSHHERFDGRGYPNGLSGENIPYMSRIISVSDAYDAMASKRVYRSPLSRQDIRNELVKGRGTQFDPNILDAFLELFDNNELDDIDETISIPLDNFEFANGNV